MYFKFDRLNLLPLFLNMKRKKLLATKMTGFKSNRFFLYDNNQENDISKLLSNPNDLFIVE